MKKSKIVFAIACISIASLSVVQSCKNSLTANCKEGRASVSGEQESHNNGKNCMSCHIGGGKGQGCFTVAGSIYNNAGSNPMTSGTVKLYTGPGGTGTVAATVAVDGKGNFYTPDAVNFSGGLYPSYTTTGGQTVYMGSSIGNGQCGSCHNVSTGKITAP